MTKTDRRLLVMHAIDALEEVMTAEASMHYELADTVIEALLERCDIYDKEPREQGAEVRPAADEHDAECALPVGEGDRVPGGARPDRAAVVAELRAQARARAEAEVRAECDCLVCEVLKAFGRPATEAPQSIPLTWACPRCPERYATPEDVVEHLANDDHLPVEPPC